MLATRLAIVNVLALAMTVGCTQDPSQETSIPLPERPSIRIGELAGYQQLEGQRPRAMVGLVEIGPLAEQTSIDLAIVLALPHEAERDAFLHDVYDPTSSIHRRFLTPDEYIERFNPTVESYRAVLDFVQNNNMTVMAEMLDRHHVHVRGTVGAVNRAFHVTLQQYRHPTEARTIFGPDREPSVDLHIPIKHVVGLDDFQSHMQIHAGGSGSGGLFVGQDFRKAYAPGVSMTGAGETVGVLVQNGYNPSDIAVYEQQMGFPAVFIQNVYLDGFTGNDPSSSPNLETTGDIEMALSMAPGLQQITVYGVNFNSDQEMLDILTEIAVPSRGEPLPRQITTSYGWNYANTAAYNKLRQLAAQGQALFVASGDYGAYNEQTGAGDFPWNDDPHVVSVGGTLLQTNRDRSWGRETVWNQGLGKSVTGGGYSPWSGDPEFNIPSWQTGLNFAAFGGSPTVRNMPDVSIVAANIGVYFNGTWQSFGGTSASAPLWAGFMALANQRAVQSGLPPIGLPTPAIYATAQSGDCPDCFHDITIGNNGDTNNMVGYSAVPGYDLCTGWGSPNGQPLIDALATYPCPAGYRFDAAFSGCVTPAWIATVWLMSTQML